MIYALNMKFFLFVEPTPFFKSSVSSLSQNIDAQNKRFCLF